MRESDSQQIRSLHLFKDMADEHFESLTRAAFLQRMPPRVNLIAEHDRPDFLHVVAEGAVELFSRHGGRETTIDICRPVTTFILAAVVGDLPYLASGRTLEPSRILMLPAENVRAVFDSDAAFARAIVRELSRSFRSVMKELKSQKLRTSAERLANWILVHNSRGPGNGRFALPYEKKILAARLGMTPENLSRSLGQLSRHGVAVTRSHIEIRDAETLRAFAKPSPSLDDADY